MKYWGVKPIGIGLFVLLMLVSISAIAPAPLVITVRDVVDYNVTYNSTTELEYFPEDDVYNALRMPLINGTISVYNAASIKVSSINITLNDTSALYDTGSGPDLTADLSSDVSVYVHDYDGWDEQTGGRIILSIPDLPSGDTAVFRYRINSSEVFVREPINVTANVTTNIEQGRVFTNVDYNVTIRVENRLPNTNITLNGTEFALNNFTINNNTGFMSFSEGGNVTLNDETLVWQNVTLDSQGDWAEMNFAIRSPNYTSGGESCLPGDDSTTCYNKMKNWRLVSFGVFNVDFESNTTLWPVNITHIEAVTDADMAVAKNRKSAWNWTSTPSFSNPTSEFHLQLNRFTTWATKSQVTYDESTPELSFPDPGATQMPDTYYQWNETTCPSGQPSALYCDDLPKVIAPGESWNANNSIKHEFYNDTVVPLIWGTANFTIVNNASNIERRWRTQNRTGEGKYVYYQKIMLLYGYFLQATKKVRAVQDQPGLYYIEINLENIGVSKTPNSTLLADLIPKGFNLTFDYDPYWAATEGNMTLNTSDSGKSANEILWSRYGGNLNFTGKSPASGSFTGAWTYFWEFKQIVPGEMMNITYYVNGTGEYSANEMYIVGVDPVQTNRLAASRLISSIDGMRHPADMAEDYVAPLGLGLFALSLFSFKKKKTPEENYIEYEQIVE